MGKLNSIPPPVKDCLGQDSYRSYDARKKESLYCGLLEEDRTDAPSQIRADLHANLVVFERNHAVALQDRPLAGLAETLVRIETVRVVRRGDRTCWHKLVRQQQLRGLCRFKHYWTELSRLRRLRQSSSTNCNSPNRVTPEFEARSRARGFVGADGQGAPGTARSDRSPAGQVAGLVAVAVGQPFHDRDLVLGRSCPWPAIDTTERYQ